jgi:hypothetical protein
MTPIGQLLWLIRICVVGTWGLLPMNIALWIADWRDVDVRCILDDAAFAALFPQAGQSWEQDTRWLLLTVSISAWLPKQSGLPVDFQFQPATHVNKAHGGQCHALGLSRMWFAKS